MIVVLVILAILAAILVPALLGWIDKAREKQYVLDARSVYMATQAVADEWYAKKSYKTPTEEIKIEATGTYAKEYEEISSMSDVSFTDITIPADSWLTRDYNSTGEKAAISKMTITGLGEETDPRTAELADGTWTITEES